MRIDQDINFEVGGVPCVMQLDTTAIGHVAGDLWIIKPRDPRYIKGLPGKWEAHFASRIADALEKLTGLDEDGVLVRVPRQTYYWLGHDDYANLEVGAGGEGWTLASGIMASQPDWDGHSFDFFGSERLARLLADWKDAIPEIQFTRSDGTVIEYEKFVEHGGDPLAKMFHDFFDDLL